VVEATCGVPRPYLIRCPRSTSIGLLRHREFQLQSVGVEQGKVLLAEFFSGVVVNNAICFQPVFPEIETTFGYGITDFGNLPGAAAPGFHAASPREEC